MALTKKEVIDRVANEVAWWVNERIKKLQRLSHDTMAVNPFMAPVLIGFHGFGSFAELAEYLIGAHLAAGHATGFGKLIDEKILPRVFGTTKLDRSFRSSTEPYGGHLFDEIDHLVSNDTDGTFSLLSLKSSRWTIQLTMAVQLNAVFREMVALREAEQLAFNEIVVGVVYGSVQTLTDKYDILRGINRGASHEVENIEAHVRVLAGRELWAWLNGGQQDTHEWVLEGVIQGYQLAKEQYGEPAILIERYKAAFNERYSKYVSDDGTVDWLGILHSING